MQSLFVDPGAMRAELTVLSCQRVDDGIGGFVEEWGETGLVFARIEPAGARDYFAADQTQEQVTHRITMRWRADIASGMRLAKGVGAKARLFDVATVHDPDETGRYLVCRASEVGR